MKNKYITKQLRAILSFLKESEGRFHSAKDIMENLNNLGFTVGLTTVYRQLRRLEEEGLVVSNKLEGNQGLLYSYRGDAGSREDSPFYLQCEDCGRIVNFKCNEITHLYNHIQADHNFDVNPQKTIFYGHCGCAHKTPSK